MNLRQNPPETKATSHSGQGGVSPWYRQPETVAVPEAAAPQREEAGFEPAAAERILGRAGALQDAHRQRLSLEQIETVAAELGIRPEFVRLAIEQEKNGVIREQPLRAMTGDRLTGKRIARASWGAILAYGLIATTLLMQPGHFPYQVFQEVVFLYPALLALVLGVLNRSRQRGAVLGAALAAAVFVAAEILFTFDITLRNGLSLNIFDLIFFVCMIGSGAILGTAGAEVRRQVSRRQVTNRSRRAARAQPPQRGF